ncbi:MAG: NUDIX hydrolase [candidate division KSB1 bacterium]|nr:NUDIX hydrolase [candidate division KSB1 bacterium]MDZ7273945.1 NUDIX hydrolase [candidate division KSB1 bacterium]MDZ7286101.1 NUDIX hydrolase [candidate division KSB1 bacterium]MDZ7299133.1 NUDIX hydrolase [candidate division KSB1 bacterium]MDZ7349722.1 NUDIX hydrolase [candidate division KSB1 bacterium]
MSRIIFAHLSPAFIILAGLVFVLLLPGYRQHVLIDFGVVYYAMLRFSHWRFGPPVRSNSPPLTPLAIDRKARRSLREIALYEYEYIRETMAQAMNDRHVLVNYFLLITGLLIAAIGVLHSREGMSYSPYTRPITIAICLLLSFVAWIYQLKIIRLRQAWCESGVAMNRVKQFFLVNAGLSAEHPGSPFLWKSTTLPRPARKGNLYHLSFILISFIAAVAVAFVSVLQLPPGSWQHAFWVPLLFFGHHFLLQLSTYDVFLEDRTAAAASGGKAGRPEPASRPAGETSTVTAEPPQTPRQVIIHQQEIVYRNFFEIQKATLQHERLDGQLTPRVQRFNCSRGHAAGILLLTPAGNEFILVEQFRYPAYVFNPGRAWLIEIVAGILEGRETPLELVRRETLEETGYEVNQIEFLTEFFPSPGGSSERVYLFFGIVGNKLAAGGGLHTESEYLRVLNLPVTQAYAMAERGLIDDGKTLLAMHLIRPRLSVSV